MPLEKQYRLTVNRLAIALLLFAVLGLLQGVLLGMISVFTDAMHPVVGEIVYELCYALFYAAHFCLPVLLYHRLPPRGASCASLSLQGRMPSSTPYYVLFGIALVSAAAYVNAFAVSIFDYAEFSGEVLWQSDVSTNYQLVLSFLTLAVIPAFAEELLFRGLVLGNLLPYGKTGAILASAVLFGLMHRNVEQMLYATAAGVVLGWVFVSTKSIWPCVLLHFFNNFQNVLSTALRQRLPAERATAALCVIEGGIFLLGILAGVRLFLTERKERREEEGAKLCPRERVFGFLSIPMLLFCAYCVVEMVLLLIMSQLYLK